MELSETSKTVCWAHEAGYKVNEDGEVISPSGKVRKCDADLHGGYLRFTVNLNGKFRSVPVHKLVAYSKFGLDAFDEGIEVRHLDGNQQNNRDENISIGTPSRNRMDMPAEQRIALAQNAASKRRVLTDDQVASLRLDRKNGMTYPDLVAKYGVAKSTISYILNHAAY